MSTLDEDYDMSDRASYEDYDDSYESESVEQCIKELRELHERGVKAASFAARIDESWRREAEAAEKFIEELNRVWSHEQSYNNLPGLDDRRWVSIAQQLEWIDEEDPVVAPKLPGLVVAGACTALAWGDYYVSVGLTCIGNAVRLMQLPLLPLSDQEKMTISHILTATSISIEKVNEPTVRQWKLDYPILSGMIESLKSQTLDAQQQEIDNMLHELRF